MGLIAAATRILALLGLALLTWMVGPAVAQDQSLAVEVRDFAFNPASLTVAVGSTVTWSNADSVPHTATGPGFDTGTLSGGGSGTATFAEAGEFAYRCNIHSSMQGVVIVQ